jgi:Trypsin
MSRKLFGSIASFSFLALSCQTPSSEIRATNQTIFNGDPDNIVSHRAVVALTDFSGFPFCTGTFVGSRTIVSAAHCFLGGAPDLIFFGNNPEQVANSCGTSTNCGFFPVVASDDPGFNANTLLNDLSVIRISQNPTLNGQPVAPIPFTRFSDNTNLSADDEGSNVSFSGFGITENTNGGTKLVVGNIPLTAVGPDNNVGGSVGSIDDNQVYYKQPLNIGGPCSGDSGGPMFINRGGVEFLAAVTSFGDFDCVIDGVSTRVDQFDTFIEGFCGAANCGQGGVGPINEVCTNNADDDGDGAVDCSDLDCANAANCQVDAEVCNDGLDNDADGDTDCDDADCADDAACQDVGRKCSVTPASSNDNALVLLFALFGLSLFISRKRTQ